MTDSGTDSGTNSGTNFGKTFGKTLVTLAILGGLTAMTPMMAEARPMKPAPAMSYHHDRQDPAASGRIDARVASLAGDIKSAQRMHHLTVREASRLTGKLDAVKSAKRQDERSGHILTEREAASLNASLDSLSAQLRTARR